MTDLKKVRHRIIDGKVYLIQPRPSEIEEMKKSYKQVGTGWVTEAKPAKPAEPAEPKGLFHANRE